jgi:hypothetical protein
MLLLATLTVLGGAAIGLTARQGKLALQEARYKSLKAFVLKLDMSLQFETQELVQDIRFLTDFPLTRAVAASQSPGTTDDGKLIEGDAEIDIRQTSPDEWLARQGRLMDGVLEANPEYLVLSSVRFENPNMTELVRSERLSAGMRPRRVPKEQLYSGSHPDSDNQFYDLRPGEVVLTTGDQLAENVPTKNRSPLVVVAICPIFDETGNFFGINVIEVDLRQRLEELFRSSAHVDFDVFVTDRKGAIAMAFQDGGPSELPIRTTTEEVTKWNALFDDGSAISTIGDSRSFYAARVRLGGNDTEAQIAIIARIKAANSETP